VLPNCLNHKSLGHVLLTPAVRVDGIWSERRAIWRLRVKFARSAPSAVDGAFHLDSLHVGRLPPPVSGECNHHPSWQWQEAGCSQMGFALGWQKKGIISRPIGYDQRGLVIIGMPPAGRNVTRRTGHTAWPEASSSLK
jgi:hypothetical protein